MTDQSISPNVLLEAAVNIERDLSVFTGAELMARYSASEDMRLVFSHIAGKPVEEISVSHNPFWHYILQTWYKPKVYRSLLYPPRHRDEVADAVLKMALGELDSYDGVLHEYPRRALKSFFMKMQADWLPKRHKIVDDMDITILYTHNIHKRAKNAMQSVKNMNRRNIYIKKHFGEGCFTVTGNNANFVIPMGEWGNSEEWDWPCRSDDYMVDQKNITAEAALGKKAGAGYNYKLLDDWEAEDSRESDAIRSALADQYDQQRQLNAPPFTREWVGGTPYHQQSFYKPMVEGKHEDGTSRYYVIKVPVFDSAGESNFPTIPRLSKEQMAKERANEIKRRGTDRFWYLQYMLDPSMTGETAMSFDWFQPLTPSEMKEKFNSLPKFRAVFIDPAWKGDDNHQEGADAAIVCIDIYSIAGQIECVLLDGTASNDMESDEGADEALRMMRVWHTHYYVIEQQADKPMVGLMKRVWKTTPRADRPSTMPRFIDPKRTSKKAKNDRISILAGQAKTGNWYYLTTLNRDFLELFKTTANEYPASVKRDTLDAMAYAHSPEVLGRWVPMAVPAEDEMERERDPIVYAKKYTGLPAIVIH